MWLQSPKKYIETYIYDGPKITSPAMDFGSHVSETLENDEDSGDLMTDLVLAQLPRYKIPEYDIEEWVKTPHGYVLLKGKLDTFDPTLPAFREYKTGVQVWTKGRVLKHKQLDHYQTLIWLRFKKLAQKIHLDWAQTQKHDDLSVSFTGKVQTFERTVTMTDVLEYLTLVSRVALEIDQAYRKELALHANKTA